MQVRALLALAVVALASVAGTASAALPPEPHWNVPFGSETGTLATDSVRPGEMSGGQIGRSKSDDVVDSSVPTGEIFTRWDLTDLKWDQWGTDGAHATGNVLVSWRRKKGLSDTQAPLSPVEVQLGNLVTCGTTPLFTSYHLTLIDQSNEPRYFKGYRDWHTACRVNGVLAKDTLGKPTKSTYKYGDCGGSLGAGAHPDVDTPDASRKHDAARSFHFCRMMWRGWTKPIAVAKGVYRTSTWAETRDYGAKITMSDPVWCAKAGPVYTSQQTIIYGRGIVWNPRRTGLAVSRGTERKLRQQIDKSGVTRRAFRHKLPKSELRDLKCMG